METKGIYYDYSSFSKIIMDLILIFGPNLAFISQIIKFRSSKSSDGFSKKITLFILVANILRIFFWYGKRFDISLLFQSIVSIIMQIFLIRECLKATKENLQKKLSTNSFKNLSNECEGNEYCSDDEDPDNFNDFEFVDDGNNAINEDEDIELKNKKDKNENKKLENYKNKEKRRNIIIKEENEDRDIHKNELKVLDKLDFTTIKDYIGQEAIDDILNIKMFWEWPYLIDYLFFCLFFTIIFSIFFSIFGFQNIYFIEGIGYTSLIVESIIGVPQIFENLKNKSTKNLSFFMIFIWLMGDTMKTLYFLKFKSPIQFVICGFIQMIIDCSIIFQINYYRNE